MKKDTPYYAHLPEDAPELAEAFLKNYLMHKKNKQTLVPTFDQMLAFANEMVLKSKTEQELKEKIRLKESYDQGRKDERIALANCQIQPERLRDEYKSILYPKEYVIRPDIEFIIDEITGRTHSIIAACELKARTAGAEEAIKIDKSGLATALGEIAKTLDAYSWAMEGRGPYAYDDDRYKQEFGNCIKTCSEIASKALHKSGLLVVSSVKGDDIAAQFREEIWDSFIKRIISAEEICRTIFYGYIKHLGCLPKCTILRGKPNYPP